MRIIFTLVALAVFVPNGWAGSEAGAGPPPVATFSIVAVDPETGEIGVAVQSKFLAVGAVVPWAKAGVGAVATQAWANIGYGVDGLELLAAGRSAEDVIKKLTSADQQKDRRQVAVIAANGKASNFTGTGCLDWAGGIIGKDFAVQGNLLAGKEVVEAMAESLRVSAGKAPLAQRLIDALRDGQKAGGDKRGRQSAALLVVRKGWGYGGMGDRFRDLRVDDHETPIEELQRLYTLHRKIVKRPQLAKEAE